jgi:Tol biopolymer transport system component
MELEFIAGKCLAKDAADRYQQASDIAVDLRTLAEKLRSGRSAILRTSNLTTGVPATMTAAHTVNPAEALPPDAVVMKRSSKRALQALAIATTLAFLGVLAVLFTQAPPERTVTRFSFVPDSLAEVHISPDGKYILYAAGTDGESSLWLRSLSDESARELPGTEGAIDGFWSPDSLEIGVVTSGWELKRVSIDGGSPIKLCELPARTNFYGGTWSPDGERIVFSSGLQLYEIAARGGQPQLLFDASGEPRPVSRDPHFLPTSGGPPGLVYSAANTPADRRIAVLNLETGERRELGPGTGPVYSQDGYLIHGAANADEPGLWALPFSLGTLEPTGDAFPISTAGFTPSVSRDSTLAYRDQAEVGALETLVWRSRAGELLETVGQPQALIGQPALSPDGQRVAVRSGESSDFDIWVHDLTRSTKTRLTFEDVTEANPAWSPSGREIVYRIAGLPERIMRRAADGTGEAVALVEAEGQLYMPDWSRDGRYLVYREGRTETRSDIRYVELGADGTTGEPVTFLDSPADESAPKLSPDGRFLAYASDESGRPEIYVRPFPSGDGKWQASVNGGTAPRWRSDGRELYYAEGANTLMSVSVSTESAFTPGQPQPLFEAPLLASTSAGYGGYDVSADGQRFVTIAPVEAEGEETAPPAIRVVQNWYEEFRNHEQD